MEFGLPEATLSIVRAILGRYAKVDKAILYGSRAMGTFKTGSDIDLTLVGSNLDFSALASISSDFDESEIPYKVDLSLFAHIDNANLIEHIQRVGKGVLRAGVEGRMAPAGALGIGPYGATTSFVV